MSDEIDYTKQSATYLIAEAARQGIVIRSAHAHALVAAGLGFQSRKALLDGPDAIALDDPWLSQEKPDVDEIHAAVDRMRSGKLDHSAVPFIAATVRAGLTPACECCNTVSGTNMPIGNVDVGEQCRYVCQQCIARGEHYVRCLVCGNTRIHRHFELDEAGMCFEHIGEFDQDDEEREDFESLAEYLIDKD